MKYRIYMDVCCLNRPLDNSQQDRIRLETEAILSIYQKCRLGEWVLIGSEAIDLEISQNKDIKKLEQLKLAISIAKEKCMLSNEIKQRIIKLTEIGLKSFDAAHVASAEFSGADVFLTTDDRLLKRATSYSGQLGVRVSNPVQWFIDISQSQGD
jgi:hypothetical protein